MVMAVSWAKEYNLLEKKVKWYQEKWSRGHILENSQAKLVWDFEFNLRKTTTSRRPDLILEEKEKKNIWICDMACPQENNVEKKRIEKNKTNYRQLAFELREQRPGFKVRVVPLVISALGGGIKETIKELVVAEMQKTILMDSETIIRKVLSGLVQSDIE